MESSIDINMLDQPGVRGSSSGSGSDSLYPKTNGMSVRAAQACAACRKQKRKCNKALPACSLCIRMTRRCDYNDITPTPNADDFAQLRKKVVDLESRLDGKSNGFGKHGALDSRNAKSTTSDSVTPRAISNFPSLFFLDSDIYQDNRMSIVRPEVHVSDEVMATLGSIVDMQDIAGRYFENVHTWLPVVSKMRMQLTLGDPRLDVPADLSLLLLSMKLIMQRRYSKLEDAQNQLYSMVKRQITLVESAAMISLQLLQALILVASYEIGQAIYPAAYLTTGQCIRIGQLLGVHDRKAVPQILKRSGAWTEIEEVKRAWWACMLLDRFVCLGIKGRPSATGDPPQSAVLPADDYAWDQGELTMAEPLYVSTATTVRAGAFARTCQATHLLGRTLRVLNDDPQSPQLRFTEAAQLYRTIEALSKLLTPEGRGAPLHFTTPMALCYGAIITLCDPFSCTEDNRGEHTVEETQMQEIAIGAVHRTSEDVLKLSAVLREIIDKNLSAISPLTSHALYMAAGTYAWLSHETGSQDANKKYHELRDTLAAMNARWAVGGEYVKALDVTRKCLYKDDPSL